MIDYGHNIGGFEEVGKFVQKLKAKRLVGVIGVPGDRTDGTIIRAAAKCGEIFDRIYLKEDDDLRGRASGEVADIMYTEILKSHDAADVRKILSEAEALKAAVSEAEEGDFIIHFYEDLTAVMEIINSHKQQNTGKLLYYSSSECSAEMSEKHERVLQG
jgi:cyanophycin synthetase